MNRTIYYLLTLMVITGLFFSACGLATNIETETDVEDVGKAETEAVEGDDSQLEESEAEEEASVSSSFTNTVVVKPSEAEEGESDQAVDEAAAKKAADQAAAKKAADQAAAKKAAEEAAAKKAAEELAAKKEAEELAAKKEADELAAKRAAEELAAKKAAEQPATVYADGSFSAGGSYSSPGGPESIGVTVNLKGDRVDSVSVRSNAENATSKVYQKLFIDGIGAVVNGKNIDSVSVGKVNGSSLTGGGFNKAIASIKAQARN